jgi:hypothetical protein
MRTLKKKQAARDLRARRKDWVRYRGAHNLAKAMTLVTAEEIRQFNEALKSGWFVHVWGEPLGFSVVGVGAP